MSSVAYFLAKDTFDHFNTVIKPVVYLSMYYFFTNPRSSFADNYIVMLCLLYCVTGIAYVLAIFFEPGPAQLVSEGALANSHFIGHLFSLTSFFIAVVSSSSGCFDSHRSTAKQK